MDGVRPETVDRPEVVLLGARHPGLSGRVVPIDIRLGDGYVALVVTGPNTGGKTVTLRTLGLLALMHQAGLHLPIEAGGQLPVFRDVFADIGDEQSVAQSLSTFSGHIRSIIRIVEAAGPGTLVLLDELGAGTDPTEGSALAQALLDHFIRAGALVAATTHYAELKAYAHTTAAARNASVEFDLETLSPDLPPDDRPARRQPGLRDRRTAGPARRDRGRCPLAPVRVGALVRGHPEPRSGRPRARRATAWSRRARPRRGRPTRLRVAQEERRAARRERDELVRSARIEGERLVAGLQEEVQATRQALERETVTGRSLDAALARAEAGLAELPIAAEEPDLVEAVPAAPHDWRLGDRARSRTGGWEGRLAALEKNGRRATVEVGEMRVMTDVDDLELLEPAPAASPPEETLAAVWPTGPSRANPVEQSRSRKRREPVGTPNASGSSGSAGSAAPAQALRLDRIRTVASSLDLRGARVDEALELFGRYIDDASLAGLERVTIIHGVGTGPCATPFDRPPPATRWSPRSGQGTAAKAATGRP